MSSGIVMTSAMLTQFGKKRTGVIKPDAHGYRTHVLGGFGIRNETGIYYDAPSAINGINTSPILNRKLEKQMLGGEADHPDITGLSVGDALRRLCDISVKYKSHNIRGIRIITDKYQDDNGRFFPAVEGDIAPSKNQYGDDLERDFNDPYHNTAFSIRTLLDPIRSTDKIRYITIPITWDRVSEPGIKYANKYYSIGQEAYQPLELAKFKCGNDVLDEVIYNINRHGGTEDVNEILLLLQSSFKSKMMLPTFLK